MIAGSSQIAPQTRKPWKYHRLYLLGSVVVDIPFVNNTEVNYILLKNVRNPTTNLSSYFQVCLRKNGVKIEC